MLSLWSFFSLYHGPGRAGILVLEDPPSPVSSTEDSDTVDDIDLELAQLIEEAKKLEIQSLPTPKSPSKTVVEPPKDDNWESETTRAASSKGLQVPKVQDDWDMSDETPNSSSKICPPSYRYYKNPLPRSVVHVPKKPKIPTLKSIQFSPEEIRGYDLILGRRPRQDFEGPPNKRRRPSLRTRGDVDEVGDHRSSAP